MAGLSLSIRIKEGSIGGHMCKKVPMNRGKEGCYGIHDISLASEQSNTGDYMT